MARGEDARRLHAEAAAAFTRAAIITRICYGSDHHVVTRLTELARMAKQSA